MGVTQDRHIKNNAKIALRHLTLYRASVAASQADTKVSSARPGYAFEIVGVQAFAGSVTAAATIDVKIGTTSALSAAATPVAGTRTDAALAAASARKGSATQDINVHVTTDGTGALGDLTVVVTIRPRGLRGDAEAVL